MHNSIRRLLNVTLLSAVCFLIACDMSAAQTIGPGTYNLPEDGNIGEDNSIGSNTTVNVFENGVIGDGFEIGVDGVVNVDTVVNNIAGTMGTSVIRDGGVLNVSGGVNDFASATQGGTINVSGGSISDTASYFAASGTLSGGEVRSVVLRNGSNVSISGGSFRFVNELRASGQAQSFLAVSGGVFSDAFASRNVEFSGAGFRHNGNAVTGSFVFQSGDVLSGTLSDGNTFLIKDQFSAQLSNVSIVETAVPDIGDTNIVVDSNSSINSLRAGQHLTIVEGGELTGPFTSLGAEVDIQGGMINGHMEFGQSNVSMSGGEFDVIGTDIEIADDSTFQLSGGRLDALDVYGNSEFQMSGGVIEDLINIGSIENQPDQQSSFVRVSGGEILARLNVFEGNVFEVEAVEFFLDGVEIDLEVNSPLELLQRNGELLTGTFSDGNSFSFDLSEELSTNQFAPDFISSGATFRILQVAAIPEPSAGVLLLCFSGWIASKRKRR